MSDDIKLDQMDANIEDSSVPQNDAASSEVEAQADTSQDVGTSGEQAEKPFHEHERFKELISEKNKLQSELEAQRREFMEMRSYINNLKKASEPKPAEHPVLEQVKQVNPEFAEYIKGLESKASQVEQLEQWRQQYEAQATAQRVKDSFNRLHEENKVDPFLRGKLEAQIAFIAQNNPQLTEKDLPRVYKETLKEWSDYLDQAKRTERAQYVESKAKDTAIPASKKGKPASTAKDIQWSSDPEERRSQMAQRILKEMREGKEV